jgi:hypothetical protein
MNNSKKVPARSEYGDIAISAFQHASPLHTEGLLLN